MNTPEDWHKAAEGIEDPALRYEHRGKVFVLRILRLPDKNGMFMLDDGFSEYENISAYTGKGLEIVDASGPTHVSPLH